MSEGGRTWTALAVLFGYWRMYAVSAAVELIETMSYAPSAAGEARVAEMSGPTLSTGSLCAASDAISSCVLLMPPCT